PAAPARPGARLRSPLPGYAAGGTGPTTGCSSDAPSAVLRPEYAASAPLPSGESPNPLTHLHVHRCMGGARDYPDDRAFNGWTRHGRRYTGPSRRTAAAAVREETPSLL